MTTISNKLLNICFVCIIFGFQIFYPIISNADSLDQSQSGVQSGIGVFLPVVIHDAALEKLFPFFAHNLSKLEDVYIPAAGTGVFDIERLSNIQKDERSNNFALWSSEYPAKEVRKFGDYNPIIQIIILSVFILGVLMVLQTICEVFAVIVAFTYYSLLLPAIDYIHGLCIRFWHNGS